MSNRWILIFCYLTFGQTNFALSQSVQDTIIELSKLCNESEFWSKEKGKPERYEKSLEVNEAILDLDCKKKVLSDSLKAIINLRLSRTEGILGNAERALFYAYSALEPARSHYEPTDVHLIRFLVNVASIHQLFFDDIMISLQVSNEIKKIRKNNPLEDLSSSEKINLLDYFFFLGQVYDRIKEEEKFEETFKEIDQLILNIEDKSLINPSKYALIKSYGYLKFGRKEEAYQIVKLEVGRQDSLFGQGNIQIRSWLLSKALLGDICISQKKYDEALVLYEECEKIKERNNLQEGLFNELYLSDIGIEALQGVKRYREADSIIRKMILMCENEKTENLNPVIAQSYNQLAENQYLEAGVVCDDSLLYLSYKNNNKAIQYLQLAWQNIENKNDFIEYLDEYSLAFDVSLQTLHALYNKTDSLHYFEEALRLMELTKNVRLRSNIDQELVMKQFGIPISLQKKEQLVDNQLFNVKYELDHATDETIKNVLEDSIYRMNKRLLNLQESLHRDYPNYISRVHTKEGFKWSSLEKHLFNENQTLLYFFSGDDDLYTLGISPIGRIFHKTSVNIDSMQEWVTELRETIYSSPTHMKELDKNRFKYLSHKLHQIILDPVEEISTPRLLVLPDSPLEIIPFSLLLSDVPDDETPFNGWPFALNQYSFSHAYALDLLLNSPATKKTIFKEKILAFAPDFSISLTRGDSTRFEGDLENNKDEVLYIEDKFETTTFIGDEARLSTFREEASNYAVLHLATHAVADIEEGDYSYLTFSHTDSSDYQLSVGELYTMDIPADLVVLSACETGLGEWEGGEGVIGLERAFSYAGAKSLVTTHWKVSDKASANLMGYFYDELAKGLPKDQALQNAQLSFIKEQDNWLAHPFFWAAYIQKGNTAPLSIPKKTTKWIWWLLGIGVMGCIFVLNKKQPFFNAN